jgi:hypothetical protein
MTDTSTTTSDTQPTFAQKLRAVADLIEAHPDLPLPSVFAYQGSQKVDVSWQLMNNEATKQVQRAAAVQIVQTLGGSWDKSAWDDRFDLSTERDGLDLKILSARDQVCERIVTGVETVTVPAVEAQPERTEEREVVEWRCEPLLAGRDEAVSA